MDAIEMLERDHREVEELFAQLSTTSGPERQQTLNKLAKKLDIHAEVEEAIVYPAMKKAGLDSQVSEATDEHQKAKDLLLQIEGVEPTSPEIDGLVAQLEAEVSHHVEEEEGQVFPKFRDAVGQDYLVTLAEDVKVAEDQARRTQEPRHSRLAARTNDVNPNGPDEARGRDLPDRSEDYANRADDLAARSSGSEREPLATRTTDP